MHIYQNMLNRQKNSIQKHAKLCKLAKKIMTIRKKIVEPTIIWNHNPYLKEKKEKLGTNILLL